ncbi:MAG: indole-3-glycerol phosphate synthase TrpC, partial [Candidatus Syntrophonatronum acetioxidans]
MFLEKILDKKKDSLKRAEKKVSLERLKENLEDNSPPRRDFRGSLERNAGRAVIAEIKRSSPSKGVLSREKDPLERAVTYEKSGAAALSILTEEDFFAGSLEDLTRVKGAVKIPVLRKDFIISEYQVYESRSRGADALLLIASILPEEDLRSLLEISYSLSLDPLVEVHTREDLEKALNCGADIIGINNRDLKTFQTSLEVTLELVARIPANLLVVSESGIKDFYDIKKLREAGVDAFLIGEALMVHSSPGEKIKELLGGFHGKG